jgi:hypothetical protein
MRPSIFSPKPLILAVLAGLLTAGTAAASSQQSFVTVVIQQGTAPGLVAGFRTSDPGASFVNCTVSGTNQTCSVENSNSSIPKNLGNIVCLPAANANYKLSDRCTSLIKAGSGSCQTNSSASQCGSGTTPVYPVCNYRTTSNKSNPAYWVWNVVSDGGNYTVDCLQAGYTGPNPK